MNTADRSIALIDATMRRRFHFVPFFPHDGMMKDLLRHWLADGNGRTAVADFLDAVNQELLPLVGEHLLIGPSHFMKADLLEKSLKRIWTYNVFPMIEEQTVGRPAAEVRRSRSPRGVRKRARPPGRRPGTSPAATSAGPDHHRAWDVSNTWRVTASSYVGTLVTSDLRILIIPKVTTANLFYLLEAGGDLVDVGPAVFDYDTTRDLIPSFATFYARHLENALNHGVPRAYAEMQERLPGIRGRIDLPAQARLAGVPIPTECRFDEYTADIRVNRILCGAATRLMRLPGITSSTRQALQRLVGLLAEAGP